MNVDRHYAACRSILPWSLAAAALTVGCPAARIDYSFEEHTRLSGQNAEVTPGQPGTSAAGVDGVGDAGSASTAAGGAGPTTATTATGGQAFVPDAGSPAAGGTLAQPDSDHDKIQSCQSQSPCQPSYAQMTDDFYTQLDPAKATCLMTALAAVTPGLYLHNVTSNSMRGNDSTEHAFLVGADGSVVHTAKRTTAGGQFALQGTSGITYTDAERCSLAGSDYFEGCARAIEAAGETPDFEDPAWVCLFSDPTTVWLTGCQPTDPVCG